MPRFFTTDICGSDAVITGDDARHIALSLRMRAGEVFDACDCAGFDYKCEAKEISPQKVVAAILGKSPSKSEPRVRLSLFQALPKRQKLESIAQKAVELGVYEIIPFFSSRCVSRWDAREAGKKLIRLKKIALEAAKQSGRGIVPQVRELLGFEAAVSEMLKSEMAVMFYEEAKTPLREILDVKCKSVSVMTGSEGGFSREEAAYADGRGVERASLGERILRCETAPICAVSAIMYAYGEF